MSIFAAGPLLSEFKSPLQSVPRTKATDDLQPCASERPIRMSHLPVSCTLTPEHCSPCAWPWHGQFGAPCTGTPPAASTPVNSPQRSRSPWTARRHRPSQAKVRSTIQRFGSAVMPSCSLGFPTVSSLSSMPCLRSSVASLGRFSRHRHMSEAASGPPPRHPGQRAPHRRGPVCIHGNVALAAVDILAGVIASRTTTFRRLHALAVG